MCVWVDETVGEAGAYCRSGKEGGQCGDEEVGQFAKGAGWPGVDLEVRWEGVGVVVGNSVRL